jgi:hypothetical protein
MFILRIALINLFSLLRKKEDTQFIRATRDTKSEMDAGIENNEKSISALLESVVAKTHPLSSVASHTQF